MAAAREDVGPAAAPVPESPFGPGFFLGQLRAFARNSCPEPAEALPSVVVHLATGEALELCHVIGLAPSFAALAVREERRGSGGGAAPPMRTELVPYALITRITIRPGAAGRASHLGFDAGHVPQVVAAERSPEEALKVASRDPPGRRGPGAG